MHTEIQFHFKLPCGHDVMWVEIIIMLRRHPSRRWRLFFCERHSRPTPGAPSQHVTPAQEGLAPTVAYPSCLADALSASSSLIFHHAKLSLSLPFYFMSQIFHFFAKCILCIYFFKLKFVFLSTKIYILYNIYKKYSTVIMACI